MGNSSSVHRFSELSLLRRSLRATRASASAIPPTMAATSLPCTLCSCTNTNIYAWRQPQTSWLQTTTNLKVSQNLFMINLITKQEPTKKQKHLLLQQHEWEHPPRWSGSADLIHPSPLVGSASASSTHHMQTCRYSLVQIQWNRYIYLKQKHTQLF